MAREIVKAEDFVKTWQKSDTITDLVKVFGGNSVKWQTRARSLRKRGVPLKEFPSLRGGPKLNIDALTDLANSLGGGVVVAAKAASDAPKKTKSKSKK